MHLLPIVSQKVLVALRSFNHFSYIFYCSVFPAIHKVTEKLIKIVKDQFLNLLVSQPMLVYISKVHRTLIYCLLVELCHSGGFVMYNLNCSIVFLSDLKHVV